MTVTSSSSAPGPAGSAPPSASPVPGDEVVRRRQGHLPPRQVLRRRADRPAPCASCERLGLDPTDVPSWTAVDDAIVSGPDGPRGAVPAPRGTGHPRRGRAPQRARRRPGRPGPSRRAPRCSTATRMVGAASSDDRVVIDGRRRRHGPGPLRGGRRRHVVADRARRSGCGVPGYRGRVARLPGRTSATCPARRCETCASGSRPTCCPATPGRSPSATGRPTSASASSGAARSRSAT